MGKPLYELLGTGSSKDMTDDVKEVREIQCTSGCKLLVEKMIAMLFVLTLCYCY